MYLLEDRARARALLLHAFERLPFFGRPLLLGMFIPLSVHVVKTVRQATPRRGRTGAEQPAAAASVGWATATVAQAVAGTTRRGRFPTVASAKVAGRTRKEAPEHVVGAAAPATVPLLEGIPAVAHVVPPDEEGTGVPTRRPPLATRPLLPPIASGAKVVAQTHVLKTVGPPAPLSPVRHDAAAGRAAPRVGPVAGVGDAATRVPMAVEGHPTGRVRAPPPTRPLLPLASRPLTDARTAGVVVCPRREVATLGQVRRPRVTAALILAQGVSVGALLAPGGLQVVAQGVVEAGTVATVPIPDAQISRRGPPHLALERERVGATTAHAGPRATTACVRTAADEAMAVAAARTGGGTRPPAPLAVLARHRVPVFRTLWIPIGNLSRHMPCYSRYRLEYKSMNEDSSRPEGSGYLKIGDRWWPPSRGWGKRWPKSQK